MNDQTLFWYSDMWVDVWVYRRGKEAFLIVRQILDEKINYCALIISLHLGLNDDDVNEGIAQAFNITQPFRLEDFTYSNNLLLEIIFRHLENTSFDGITVKCLASYNYYNER